MGYSVQICDASDKCNGLASNIWMEIFRQFFLYQR
jgi:hypothetical protein